MVTASRIKARVWVKGCQVGHGIPGTCTGNLLAFHQDSFFNTIIVRPYGGNLRSMNS